MSHGCLDSADLGALLRGDLSRTAQAAAESHVEACAHCQVRLEELADVATVLPKSSLPAELRKPADSKRLLEIMHAMRDQNDPRTRPGVPQTDVAPVHDPHNARAVFSRRPQQIGDYDVLAVLGRGGLGVVYRATDRALGRDVAIKVLRPDLADHASLRERFLREARAAAALRHDNVVTVYGVGQHADQPYLVMEYVPGGSLADRLLRKRQLSSQEVVRLGIEVASALAAAHARGIVHRDVKPGNVLWDAESGRYKLTDFGLAKAIDDVSLTRSGTLVGTPEYLSPEQAEGRTVDARSDLFSLGAMLYAAGVGESPFHAESTIAVLDRVRTHAPPDLRRLCPDCPGELANVIHRLLAKDPARRYQSAASAAEDLRRIENGARSDAASAGPRARLGRKPTAPVAAAVAVLIAAATAVIWFATHDREGPSAPERGLINLERPFAVLSLSQDFETLAAAVSAAPADGVIEVRAHGRIPLTPIKLEKKPLVIRAAHGSRPVLVPATVEDAAEPALSTDSNLTLQGLELQWVIGSANAGSVEPTTGTSAVVATGGKTVIDHCEFLVGRDDTCLRIAGASCTVRNSRLSARQGTCLAWRPRTDDRLELENCVLSGERCLSLDSQDRTGDLPASLAVSRSTWQAKKGLELILSFVPRLPLEVRMDGNLLAVDHLVVMHWPFAGPRATKSPNLTFVRARLRETIIWQEHENLYGAATRFLSRESPRQALAPFDVSPQNVADWEAFWNRPGSGSQQGAAANLSGKVGADEGSVGPGH